MIRSLTLAVTAAATMALLTGCAGNPSPRDERLSATLAQLSETDYVASKRCLGTFEYDSIEILDDQHVLFKDRNDVWLNKLRARCPGLRRNDVLAFDMRGSRLCSLDTATVLDRFLFWQRSGPTCALGEFQQLTEPQAQLLREAMR